MSNIRTAITAASLAAGIVGGFAAGAFVTDQHIDVPRHALTQSLTVSSFVKHEPIHIESFEASKPVKNSAYGNKLTIQPCIEEDSNNCIWNAASTGNGKGDSFIAYHGQVYYLSK